MEYESFALPETCHEKDVFRRCQLRESKASLFHTVVDLFLGTEMVLEFDEGVQRHSCCHLSPIHNEVVRIHDGNHNRDGDY